MMMSASATLEDLTGPITCDDDFVALSQIPTLRGLRVTGEGPRPSITPAGAALVKKLRQLKKLDVSSDPAVLHAISQHLPALPSLEELRLGSAFLEVQRIAELKNLKVLDLTYRDLTDGELMGLAKMTALVELSLINSRITNAGLRDLYNLKNLRHLDLGGTWATGDVTRAGIADLQRALPELHVVFDEPEQRLR